VKTLVVTHHLAVHTPKADHAAQGIYKIEKGGQVKVFTL
jgi:hypothetical protein